MLIVLNTVLSSIVHPRVRTTNLRPIQIYNANTLYNKVAYSVM